MKRNQPYWLVPLLAAIFLLGLLVNPNQLLNRNPPPVESLNVEQTILNDDGITLKLRAAGSQPMQIAQVQVDGAYWQFSQQPPGNIPRLDTATLDIPYPWVSRASHHIQLLTNTGLTFNHTIDVALATPEWSLSTLLTYSWMGLYVGLVPVGLGMLSYSFLTRLGKSGLGFVLSLTVGLLAFLFVDTLQEGLELGQQAVSAFQGQALVWLGSAIAFLTLVTISRRQGKPPQGKALSIYLAMGIGLHNFGEGLAIGTAFAVGESALGTFLVVGFTLHNLTEGLGIVSPLLKHKTRWLTFLFLAMLAGLPAIPGIWLGAFAFSPHWAALCLGIGAGAILQVMVELGIHLWQTTSSFNRSQFSPLNLAGFTLGIIVMYGTAILVKF
ncbi:MAG: ZIP family metal transporter [Halothece sp.]